MLLATITVVASRHYAPAVTHESARSRPPGSVSLITEPNDGIAPIIELIKSSHLSVDLVMYQMTDQAVAEALVADRKRGVQVRVLLNHGYRGQATAINEPAYSYLRSRGVAVKWTPGFFDLTHQKSLIIDGRTLVVMTLNFTPQYYATGREFALVDRDARDVTAAQDGFEADWAGQNRIAPLGDGLVWSPGAHAPTLRLIDGATRTLDIYNEEMADSEVTDALERAAARGVHVRVCMTYATSWKSAFTELAEKGIMVRTYPSTAALYIHAKMIVADGKEAFAGSQNFSPPSLDRNRELGLLLNDPTVITQLESIFDADFRAARPYD